MSELKAFDITVAEEGYCEGIVKYRRAVYDKSEADKVIADLEESHKKEVEQLLMEIVKKDKVIAELKSRITPKQSDRPLQERLNEVCKKHGVSTLQDLDWAFCESEKSHTKDCIESVKVIASHKYKRCLAMAYAEWLKQMALCNYPESILYRRAFRREHKWKEMAQKFKEAEEYR